MEDLVHPPKVEIIRHKLITPKICCYHPKTREVLYACNEFDCYSVLRRRDTRISRNQVRACLNRNQDCPRCVKHISDTVSSIEHSDDSVWHIKRLNRFNR
jgi:hypothetical protein